jgi:hypothetical protein
MSRVLLLTHKNLSAYAAANRSLASEIEPILTRAQEMAMWISEKAVARMSTNVSQPISGEELEEMYDYATKGIRELGEATVAAQVRSIEILRDHARATVDRAKEFRNEFAKA